MLLTFSCSFETWCHMELTGRVCAGTRGVSILAVNAEGMLPATFPSCSQKRGTEGSFLSAKEFRDEIKSFNRATVTGEKVGNVHTSGTFQSQTQVSILVLSKWVCPSPLDVCMYSHSVNSSSWDPVTTDRGGTAVCKAMTRTKTEAQPLPSAALLLKHQQWHRAQPRLLLQAAVLPATQTWSNEEALSLPVWTSGKWVITIWDLRMFLYLVRIPLWPIFFFFLRRIGACLTFLL